MARIQFNVDPATSYGTTIAACAGSPTWYQQAYLEDGYSVPTVGEYFYTTLTGPTTYSPGACVGPEYYLFSDGADIWALQVGNNTASGGCDNDGEILHVSYCGPVPSPSPTPSITVSPSITPSITVSPSITPSISVSPSLTPTPTPTPTRKILPNCAFDLTKIAKLYIGNVQTSGNQLSYPIEYNILTQRNVATLGISDWAEDNSTVTIGGQEVVLYEVQNHDENVGLIEELIRDNRSQSYSKTINFTLSYIDYSQLLQTKTVLLNNTDGKYVAPGTIAFLIDANDQKICVGYDNPLFLRGLESAIGADHSMTFKMESLSQSRFRYYDLPICDVEGYYVEEICPSPTPTPTPTPTPSPGPGIPFTVLDGDPESSAILACGYGPGTGDTITYMDGHSVPTMGQYFFSDPFVTTEVTWGNNTATNWFYVERNGGYWACRVHSEGVITDVWDCLASPTPTPTLTSTPTPTPTVTPSISPSVTPSISVSPSQTPSQTPTVTPTITLTPSPSPLRKSFGLNNTENDTYQEACALGTPDITVYLTIGNTVPAYGLYFYTTVGGSTGYGGDPNYYHMIYDNGDKYACIITATGLIDTAIDCSNPPSPTPSRTPTVTPTITPTITPTPTVTPTHTPPVSPSPTPNRKSFGINETSQSTSGLACALGTPDISVYLTIGYTVPAVGLFFYATSTGSTGYSGDADYYMIYDNGTKYACIITPTGLIDTVVAC